MDALKETRGLYKPIRVLFSTPVYERALETCWHLQSYKTNIAVVLKLLRLQQEHLLSPEVTADQMTHLLLEKGKKSLRVQLWEFELEDRDDEVAKPLLNLTWDVISALKMRDVVFEAGRFLASPEDIPPSFQHPKLLSLAQSYARTLSQLNQDTPHLLQPREVVMEVVPKVISGLWLLPPSTSSLSMPSRELSAPAIGLTQSVLDRVSKTLPFMLQQVHFSHSAVNQIVQTILEKIHLMYPGDRLETHLSCFSIELLRYITSATAEEICALFQPQEEPEDHPEPSADLELASPLPLTEEVTEDVTKDLSTDTVLVEVLTSDLPETPEPQAPSPEPATEAQTSVELPAPAPPSMVDVGVQTTELPSPSTSEGCIFCHLGRWIRGIYSYFFFEEGANKE